MINFKPIQKEKISEYRSYYSDAEGLGCECNFVSGYLWNEAYLLRAAVYDDTLIKAYFRGDGRVWGYCFPHGKNVRGAVEAIFADAAERGQEARIAYMTRKEQESLEALFPERFTYEREPNNQDYIYLTHDLATLTGKKYHAKRNHISRFYRTYGDGARFAALSHENLSDAELVMRLWFAENDIDPEKSDEYKVFRKACADFEDLQIQGAVLYVDGKPAAMTAGSEISELCFDVMFEKALRAYDGIYAVINNEFAKTLTRYKYINREEDLGIEGLRRAKLSYYPAIIYDRFSAFPK